MYVCYPAKIQLHRYHNTATIGISEYVSFFLSIPTILHVPSCDEWDFITLSPCLPTYRLPDLPSAPPPPPIRVYMYALLRRHPCTDYIRESFL